MIVNILFEMFFVFLDMYRFDFIFILVKIVVVICGYMLFLIVFYCRLWKFG